MMMMMKNKYFNKEQIILLLEIDNTALQLTQSNKSKLSQDTQLILACTGFGQA